MSVRIDPTQLASAIRRRPFAYVVTADNDQPHLRAVIPVWTNDSFVMKVGSRTAANVSHSHTLTLVWPPLAAGEYCDDFDDHSVIADCEATSNDANDSFEVRARPFTAVWHRPAR